MMNSALLGSFLLLLSVLDVARADGICTSPTNTFTVKLDLFASELGYFYFEECGNATNPTIGLEVGQTYNFIQADRSNYYHPMGFAYFPDGAHDDKDEIEPTVTETDGNTCEFSASCPAPMYFIGDQYLGTYSNIPEVLPTTIGETDFGLDKYEPLFFHSLPEWVAYGTFNIKLRFDDITHTDDLFYFCHIHQFMSGRIKLLQNGVPVNAADEPALGYEYDTPSAFDQTCGTYNLDSFQLPNSQCPDTFVCGTNQSSVQVQQYIACLNAMNCHMFASITSGVSARSQVALFIQQMIPHHQNAVNMAKALLKTGMLSCSNLTLSEEEPHCALEVILREIVNDQNAQIQQMRSILEALGYSEFDPCVVQIESSTVRDAGLRK